MTSHIFLFVYHTYMHTAHFAHHFRYICLIMLLLWRPVFMIWPFLSHVSGFHSDQWCFPQWNYQTRQWTYRCALSKGCHLWTLSDIGVGITIASWLLGHRVIMWWDTWVELVHSANRNNQMSYGMANSQHEYTIQHYKMNTNMFKD